MYFVGNHLCCSWSAEYNLISSTRACCLGDSILTRFYDLRKRNVSKEVIFILYFLFVTTPCDLLRKIFIKGVVPVVVLMLSSRFPFN